MKNGWIKIHRRITDNPFCFENMERLGFWTYILCLANHEGKEFFIGMKKIKCNPGQFVTGRKTLANQCGVSEMKVQRWLDVLESEHQIEQQKTTQFRLITVVKWNEYQLIEQQNAQQTNNKRTTDEQQMNTNKNVKNNKNIKKRTLAADAAPTIDGKADEPTTAVERRPLSPHLRPLAMFAVFNRRVFRNSGEVSEYVKRNARVSKDISVYPDNVIAAAHIIAWKHWNEKQDYHITLETVGKYIQDAEMPGKLQELEAGIAKFLRIFDEKKDAILLPTTPVS